MKKTATATVFRGAQASIEATCNVAPVDASVFVSWCGGSLELGGFEIYAPRNPNVYYIIRRKIPDEVAA